MYIGQSNAQFHQLLSTVSPPFSFLGDKKEARVSGNLAISNSSRLQGTIAERSVLPIRPGGSSRVLYVLMKGEVLGILPAGPANLYTAPT